MKGKGLLIVTHEICTHELLVIFMEKKLNKCENQVHMNYY
jgi:hypothetical protein